MTSDLKMNMLRRTTAGDIIRRNAQTQRDKTALITSSSTNKVAKYSWNELNNSINQVANGLKAMGISKGDKIGVLSLNSFEFVILIYATGKIGATIAPVNAALNGEELTFMVRHSDAKMLFVEDRFIDTVHEISSTIPNVKLGHLTIDTKKKIKDWIDLNELLNNFPNDEPEVNIDIEDVASLSYTSGTESLPKAVMMTHGNLSNFMTTFFHWNALPSDICLHVLPLFYTGGLGTINGALLMGQTVVLPDSPDPVKIVELIKKYKVSFMILPPTLWIRLLQVPGVEESTKSMRMGTTFGASISEDMIKGWNKIAPHMSWLTYYGQSETSCSGTVGHFNHFDDICEGDLGWVGKPAHDLEIRIVDDNDNDVPYDEIGEILFRGPAVFKGYYKDEEKTERIFAGGWLHTGDLGRMNEDGELFFVDRIKDMVKSGGENISSARIEYAVSAHPKVAEVAAIGIPHQEWMEALTVVVMPKQGETLREEEIIKHCQQVLPRFQVPKFVLIVRDFPRTSSGKIMKRLVRDQYKDIASQGLKN